MLTRFISLKLCVSFSIFNSVSFLLKLMFLFNKKNMDSLTAKRHNSLQNKNNRLVWLTHSLAPRPLIFKLQKDI